jgi:hypothetical protein
MSANERISTMMWRLCVTGLVCARRRVKGCWTSLRQTDYAPEAQVGARACSANTRISCVVAKATADMGGLV